MLAQYALQLPVVHLTISAQDCEYFEQDCLHNFLFYTNRGKTVLMMDIATAKILCRVTNDFYARHMAQFAATRQSPWPGWTCCLQLAQQTLPVALSDELIVLDLACGNYRFGAFLARSLPQTAIHYHGVDRSEGDWQLPDNCIASFQALDIMDVLQDEGCLHTSVAADVCDLSVCFGFMHHIPLPAWRLAVLDTLFAQTRPGGLIAVSFWQFLSDAKLAAKAALSHAKTLQQFERCGTALVGLKDNDLLLGWDNIAGAYRYCHSFTNDEVDAMIKHALSNNRAKLLARFNADGRTNSLNSYIVLQRC